MKSAFGKVKFGLEKRKCSDCRHSKKLADGWICKKHLMGITADMRITFRLSDGTCWKPKD